MTYLALAFGLLANPVVKEDTPKAPAPKTASVSPLADPDFSIALRPQSPLLGFIGSDYQRLNIVFLSVTREAQDHKVYDITGYTLTRGTQTPFTGKLTIAKVSRLKQLNYGVDDEMKGKVKAEGTAASDYELQSADGGRFTGTMTTQWFVDRSGKLQYDDIDIASDSYSNNQYTGQWRASAASSPQVANWGEYRIPQAGDLDSGAAQFFPADKYKANGWANFEPTK